VDVLSSHKISSALVKIIAGVALLVDEGRLVGVPAVSLAHLDTTSVHKTEIGWGHFHAFRRVCSGCLRLSFHTSPQLWHRQ
jgi:hypothetical protein